MVNFRTLLRPIFYGSNRGNLRILFQSLMHAITLIMENKCALFAPKFLLQTFKIANKGKRIEATWAYTATLLTCIKLRKMTPLTAKVQINEPVAL